MANGFTEYSQAVKDTDKNIERVGGVREKPCSLRLRQMPPLELAETLLVGHDLVVMHRLMEMG